MEEHVTFPAGGNTLEGLISFPAMAPQIGVVVCHPHPLYGGEMRNNVVEGLVRRCQRDGMATLRFNFRGVGASSGSHDDGRGEVDDVKAAVAYLLSRQAVAEVAVAGYSFGSMVGLRAGAEDPRVARLVGVALPVARRDASFLKAVTKPVCLISGDRDDISPLDAMQKLAAELRSPGALTVIAGADHFFGGREEEVAAAAASFLEG